MSEEVRRADIIRILGYMTAICALVSVVWAGVAFREQEIRPILAGVLSSLLGLLFFACRRMVMLGRMSTPMTFVGIGLGLVLVSGSVLYPYLAPVFFLELFIPQAIVPAFVQQRNRRLQVAFTFIAGLAIVATMHLPVVESQVLAFVVRPLLAVSAIAIMLYATERFRGNFIEAVHTASKAETEAKASTQFFEAVLDGAPDGVVICTAEGDVSHFNRGAENMFGWSQQEMVGQSIAKLMPSEYMERQMRWAGRVLEGTLPDLSGKSIEWQAVRKSGEHFPLSLSVSLVSFDNEAFFVGAVRDISSDVQAAATEEAAKLQTAFLANMSHEIRTPLNAVIGMSNLLADTDLQAEQKGSLDVIRTSGKHLLGVINDILDISKLDAGGMQLEKVDFDIRPCLEETADIARGMKSSGEVTVEVALAEDPPTWMQGDPSRLRQVLMNLAGNAVKFTESGRVTIGAEPKGDQYEFTVMDTGIGIPEDRVADLFEPFSQVDGTFKREFQGTGLGLAIVKRFVDMMGGSVSVESVLGEGTTFRVLIPFEAPTVDAEKRQRAMERLAGKQVLLLHRNAPDALRSELASYKLKCTEAKSAAEAALALETRHYGILIGSVKELEALDEGVFSKVDGRPIALYGEGHAIPADAPWLSLSAPVLPGPLNETLLSAVGGSAERPLKDAHLKLGERYPLRVMIAEDNPVNQVVSKAMLGNLGYEVPIAENGAEALRMVEENRFDLIFMDIQMPIMDGMEATRRILELPNAPAIVGLSAHVGDDERKRCMDLGMRDYLTKPVTVDAIAGVIQDLIAEATQ